MGVSYKLLYLPLANKDIKKLDNSIKPLIKKALLRLAENPMLGKPLTENLKDYFSYRVSSYRIIYTLRNRELIVIIVSVSHRREVYEKLRKLLK
jgi:mRNA interferase RelE/StbE